MQRATLFSAAMALLVGGQAKAGIILDFTGSSLTHPSQPGNETLGWEFTVTASTTVTALGIWNDSAIPVSQSHSVGLWSLPGGGLLASATVDSSGTPVASASGQGDWLFTSISPIVLAPGNYVLGETYPTSADDNARSSVAGITTPAGITYDTGLFGLGGGLFMPNTSSSGEPGYFGPNLETAVPEPSSMILLGLFVGGIGFSALDAPAARRGRDSDLNECVNPGRVQHRKQKHERMKARKRKKGRVAFFRLFFVFSFFRAFVIGIVGAPKDVGPFRRAPPEKRRN